MELQLTCSQFNLNSHIHVFATQTLTNVLFRLLVLLTLPPTTPTVVTLSVVMTVSVMTDS